MSEGSQSRAGEGGGFGGRAEGDATRTGVVKGLLSMSARPASSGDGNGRRAGPGWGGTREGGQSAASAGGGTALQVRGRGAAAEAGLNAEKGRGTCGAGGGPASRKCLATRTGTGAGEGGWVGRVRAAMVRGELSGEGRGATAAGKRTAETGLRVAGRGAGVEAGAGVGPAPAPGGVGGRSSRFVFM